MFLTKSPADLRRPPKVAAVCFLSSSRCRFRPDISHWMNRFNGNFMYGSMCSMFSSKLRIFLNIFRVTYFAIIPLPTKEGEGQDDKASYETLAPKVLSPGKVFAETHFIHIPSSLFHSMVVLRTLQRRSTSFLQGHPDGYRPAAAGQNHWKGTGLCRFRFVLSILYVLNLPKHNWSRKSSRHVAKYSCFFPSRSARARALTLPKICSCRRARARTPPQKSSVLGLQTMNKLCLYGLLKATDLETKSKSFTSLSIFYEHLAIPPRLGVVVSLRCKLPCRAMLTSGQ